MYLSIEYVNTQCVILIQLLLIGENIRYFIYKYDLLYDDWFRDLNRIYVKLNALVHSITNYDDVCLADAIKELCETRDSELTQFVDENQIIF